MPRFKGQAECHDWLAKEGWVVGRAMCCTCGHTWEAATEPGAHTDCLECPECGTQDSAWFELEEEDEG